MVSGNNARFVTFSSLLTISLIFSKDPVQNQKKTKSHIGEKSQTDKIPNRTKYNQNAGQIEQNLQRTIELNKTPNGRNTKMDNIPYRIILTPEIDKIPRCQNRVVRRAGLSRLGSG